MTANKFVKIGDILTAARTEQGKSLKDIAEAIKIQVKYLEAVEAGNPDSLPSRPYFMLFARSYGQFLGIDPRIFEELSEYGDAGIQGEMGGKGASTIEDPKAHGRKTVKRIIWLVVAAIILFAGLLIINAVYFDNSAAEVPEEAVIPEPVMEAEKTDPVSGTGLDFDYQSYTAPEPLKLKMEAVQDVWVIVVSDGDTVLHRQLMAGDTRQWQADYRFELTLGISTAVKLTLNDLPLGPLSEKPSIISGLEINQVNYRQFYPDNQPPEENSGEENGN